MLITKEHLDEMLKVQGSNRTLKMQRSSAKSLVESGSI